MTAQRLLAEVRLRHRAAGHLRFQLPELLCSEEIADYLERGLHQLEGVRRVTLYRHQQKLSVFYLDTVCDDHQIARKLAQLIELLVTRRRVTPAGATPARGLWQRLRGAQPLAGLKARYQKWRTRARQVSAITRAHWRYNPALRMLGENPEKAILGFINDAVTFYLIKVHWNLIVQQWLKRPIRFRYEWATVFYFIFLLVRSRKK